GRIVCLHRTLGERLHPRRGHAVRAICGARKIAAHLGRLIGGSATARAAVLVNESDAATGICERCLVRKYDDGSPFYIGRVGDHATDARRIRRVAVERIARCGTPHETRVVERSYLRGRTDRAWLLRRHERRYSAVDRKGDAIERAVAITGVV